MKQKEAISKISALRRHLGNSVAVLCIIVLLQFAVGNVRGFMVVSRSMDPTLQVGDRVISVYVPASISIRGRVIAFEPDDGGSSLTKRVLAEQGDLVDVTKGKVSVNGKPDEYYHERVFCRDQHCRVGSCELFVAGDNRPYSYDSLDHGPIPRSRVQGVVAVRYWPLSRAGFVR